MKKNMNLLLALSLLVGILAGCAPAATPSVQIVKETVEVPVKETVVVKETVLVPADVDPAADPAVEAGPVTLTVYDPTGAYEVTETFASRLDSLDGKTICELMNGSWESDRTSSLIREQLQKQFPTAKIIPYDQFDRLPITADPPGLEDSITAAGCEAVIIGNAG